MNSRLITLQAQSTLFNLHKHNLQCSIYTSTIYSVQSTQAQSTVFNLHKHNLQCSIYTSTIYSVQSTQAQSTVFNLHKHNLQCSIYTSTIYSVQSTQAQSTLFKYFLRRTDGLSHGKTCNVMNVRSFIKLTLITISVSRRDKSGLKSEK